MMSRKEILMESNQKKGHYEYVGMLSIVNSIYDPLGFVTHFIVKGQRLLQLLCQDENGWDERVDDSIINQ